MNEIEIRNKTIAARVMKSLLKEFPRHRSPFGNAIHRSYLRLLNPEKELESQTNQRKIHAEKKRKQARDYYWNHRQERLDYKHSRKIRTNELNRNVRISLLRILGNECVLCGYNTNDLALQIDHINGNGSDERRIHGNTMMYKKYICNPELAKSKLQILCANCNQIKKIMNREHRWNVTTNSQL